MFINLYSFSLSTFNSDMEEIIVFTEQEHCALPVFSLNPTKLQFSSHKLILFFSYSFCLSSKVTSVPFALVYV